MHWQQCYRKFCKLDNKRYVTGSGKIGLIATITDIHFLPVRESCTHALPRNTKYLIIDGQVCFYRQLFTDAVKPPRCISWPCRALMGLHRVTAVLTAVLASLVDSISLCPILRAQHCCLGPNGCFGLPSASHPPPPPPTHPPPIDLIRDITGTEKNYPNNQQHSSSL